MPLTPEAKKLLAETIRGTAQDPEKGLRARLLRAIHDEADRRYRLSVPIAEAGLDEAHRKRRERIAAWVDERTRATKPKNDAERKATRDRLLAQAEKEAAATLLNRLVVVRHLEALGLSRPPVLTGGWNSKGYREYREFAPALCGRATDTTDATEGYGTLLQLLFDELAVDLPGLFGDVGLARLFPIPGATLREVVERLDDPGLASAWTDDTTLGWVYQYWNDPDREALDAKINDGGKIAPHEIASKTQMFTDRYMVEWLLQNSLGLTWLAMCRKHGWTPDADQVLPGLDARRAAWRAKRDAGEVALDALMPIEGELEEHWKYYVPQPIPDDAVTHAPESISALKLLDPACGSGHFLVIAFDLLASLYREEARHRGQSVRDAEIAESILENNLHGIDIDPRAVQIAAAALYLKARSFAKDTRFRRLNLVAPALQLGNLAEDDAAVAQLRASLARESGIPEAATTALLKALAGVDYLGSLLKVDASIDDTIRAAEKLQRSTVQRTLFGEGGEDGSRSVVRIESRQTLVEKLEEFLATHSTAADLGLRLDGEQLAAGVRFVRMAKEGAYDVVVGNPPYQGITKTSQFEYVAKEYPRAKADLYAAFLERGLQMVRAGGVSALVTMRGWMFLNQFRELREQLLRTQELTDVVDLDSGAFDEVSAAQVVLSVACSVFVRAAPGRVATALRPTPTEDRASTGMTSRKRAGLLAQVGRYEFDPRGFAVIAGEPVVYWWSKEFLAQYAAAPKIGTANPARATQGLYNNTRFTRSWHEVNPLRISEAPGPDRPWTPFTNGSNGVAWFEPPRLVALWGSCGVEAKSYVSVKVGADIYRFANEQFFFRDDAVAFSMIGAAFSARRVTRRGIFGDKGRSIFASSPAQVVCFLNSKVARFMMESLNPSISFQAGDVNRVASFDLANSREILSSVDEAFRTHEAATEPSISFHHPGPSPWSYAQSWAQLAVDRPDGAPLPPYEPVYEPATPVSFISFAVGVALGRFGANGEGILDDPPASALPNGILFLSTERGDSLDHPACKPLLAAWDEHGAAVSPDDDLRSYLRKSFFDLHKKLYENRPIYFPLSSARKSFVALVSIHRWSDDTLSVLLADHLVPARRRLEGELDDLRTARVAPGANKSKVERRFTEVQKAVEELNEFLAKVTDLAEKGPPPPDDKTTKREVDARYAMDLDDGVMVNSAGLWPVLEPQWKDPKKWWKELAQAPSPVGGKKDYDWSHLAARYFPTRVRAKCHEDPSLAVAHGCFWELHPAKAYAWELRLQDEIRPDFTIDEPGSDAARGAFLKTRDAEAREIAAKEQKRREKKGAGAAEPEQTELAYEAGDAETAADE